MKMLRKTVVILASVEVFYLALANLALNLPLTQELVNKHRPEKYTVSWDRAWTWYPLRVHARGVSANGQTSSQQWQADVPSASASISVLPLLTKTVRIGSVDAKDVDFRIRPRPKPDKDYGGIREFFPPIDNRDPNLMAASKVRKAGSGWTIAVDDIHARGNHKIWVYQVQGDMSGDLAANVTYTTRGGPFSLSAGEADVEVNSLLINNESVVSAGGSLNGRFEMLPFVPSEHRGKKALGFLVADAQLDLPVDSLDFLDIYLHRFNGMTVDGKGRWSGRLHYEKGDLRSGTDMSVSAPELNLIASPYSVRGAGNIRVKTLAEGEETVRVGMVFEALEAFHDSNPGALLMGENLEIVLQGDNRILIDEQRKTGRGQVVVRIPKVAVPDLSVFQYLLPDQWRVTLNGGAGELSGEAELSPASLNAKLRLISNDADIAFKDYRFVTNLDLGVTAQGDASKTATIDLGGSYLKLDDARLAISEQGTSETWNASLTLAEGTLGIPVAEGAESEAAGFRHFMQTLKEQSLSDVLTMMDADLAAQLNVSDLGWLNLPFRNPFDLQVSGGGNAEADVAIRGGWLSEGTSVRVQPKDLNVRVLDYVAQGAGLMSVAVTRGGKAPDMVLDASLKQGNLRRSSEEDSVVEDVNLEVSAKAQGVTFGEDATVTSIDLRIPSARVRNMSVYNQYFPEKLPLRLSGGTAELTADIQLERESAAGYVTLQTDGLESQLDDQTLSGELSLNVNLAGGVPSDMEFDISGSSLVLDEIRIVGEQKNFDQLGWTARFDLDSANVIWKKPVLIDLEASVTMQDSRPIVAVLANQRGKHGWIEKLLTVEDIQGKAKLQTNSGELVIPYALAGSDKIDVGAKGIINDKTREGMFLARFRKLNGILKVKDGERNFDIIGARKKFDAYTPGQAGVSFEVDAESDVTAASEVGTESVPPSEEPSTDSPGAQAEEEAPLDVLDHR